MINKIIRGFIIFLLALVMKAAIAQPLDPDKELSQYILDHLKNENIQAGILKMMQSHDGYIWMATHDNLLRFDGVKVTVYDKFNIPEFTINGFRSVYEDPNGNFWAGSDGGGLFLKQKERFKKFVVPFGAGSNNIETMMTDSKGNMWLCTLKGLVLFKDSVFTLVMPKGVHEDVQIRMYDIDEDAQGNLWLASSNGVYKYANGELKEYSWTEHPLRSEILSIHVDSEQNIWIGSYGNGVFKATDKTITRVLELGSFGRSVAMMEDRNHDMWIGTETGVARYGKNGISQLGIEEGITNVVAICEDHEGSIWLGTYYTGLARLRDGTFTNYSRLNGLPHNTIHTFFQDKDSTIWVGTENNLAFYKNGKFTIANFSELKASRIRDIFGDGNDNIWIATYNGLYKYHNNKLTRYGSRDGLSNERVRLIFEDKNKSIWVGTRNGLCLYANGRWKSFTEKDGLGNTFIMSIIHLKNDNLLIGTNTGLYTYDGQSIKPFETDQGRISNTIFRTYEDEDGYLWIGTNMGLVCIKDGKLFSFFDSDELLGGIIFQILEDQFNSMWLTSSKGVIVIPRKELIEHVKFGKTPLKPRLFNKSNGMPTDEITATSKAMIAMDGKIWFPTLQGIGVVDPANIVSNKVPPPIQIEKVLANGTTYFPEAIVELEPLSRNIEIHYTGLSYMAPEKVKFRYKLEGYDKTWNDVDTRRVAYYTSLPPGSYTFMLEAANNDGVWNKDHKALVLNVEKAYWQTWEFFAFISLSVAAIVIGVVNYRVRSIKQLNKMLDERIRERTSEVMQQKEEIETQRDFIEQKNKELEQANNTIAEKNQVLHEINETLEKKVIDRTQALSQANEELDYFVYKSSHDIKGPLARLQGLTNLALMETKEEIAKNYFAILQRESVLANRVIQKLTKAHQIRNIEVNISEIELNGMLTEIIDQLKGLHKQTESVKFILDFDKGAVIRSDKRLLKEILVNLIENAIVFQADKNPFARLEVTFVNGFIQIKVIDNGVGIDKEARADVFKIFFKGSEKSVGLGLGLFIAKKATEKLGGTLELNSNEELTEFQLTLPVN